MKRYDLIDTLRGISIISMIAFHTCWLMNYFGIGLSDEIVYGTAFTVWERSICISFIVIAGFSFSLGRHHLRSALLLSGIGLAITVITCLFFPDIRIVFGILTFLGAAAFIMIFIDRVYKRAAKGNEEMSEPVNAGLLSLSLLLFIFTYNINNGYIGISGIWSADMPKVLYNGYAATFIGFMKPDFTSADYFPLLPWIFIYMYGYFLHKAIMGSSRAKKSLRHGISWISFLGRHSLIIYLLHPVVIFLVLYAITVTS